MSLLALAALLPVSLVWSPKAGDKAVYDAKGKVVYDGNAMPTQGSLTRWVKRVEKERVIVGEDLKFTVLTPTSTQDAPFVPTESVLRPDGQFVSLSADVDDATPFERVGRLVELVLSKDAVKPGGTWTSELLPDRKAGGLGAKLAYVFVGEEKVGDRPAYKIESKGAETGEGRATETATFWVDEKTGTPLRMHYDLQGLNKGPGGEGAPEEYEQELVVRP